MTDLFKIPDTQGVGGTNLLSPEDFAAQIAQNPKGDPFTPPVPQETIESENILGGGAPISPEPETTELNDNEKPVDLDVVAAKMLVEVQDIVLPAAIALFCKFVLETKINAKTLKMAAQEKNLLAEQTAILLKHYQFKLDSPLANYALCLVGIYAAKIPAVIESTSQDEVSEQAQRKAPRKATTGRGVKEGTKRGPYNKKS